MSLTGLIIYLFVFIAITHFCAWMKIQKLELDLKHRKAELEIEKKHTAKLEDIYKARWAAMVEFDATYRKEMGELLEEFKYRSELLRRITSNKDMDEH